jgi:D-alanyl-D-alanine carboxypeptidase
MMLRILIFPLLLFITFSSIGQIHPSYASRLQFVLDSTCKNHNIIGASASVVVPGLGIWKGVSGISEIGTPMHTEMVLGIGSNTKTYLTAIFFKLQEQNLIQLNDTIGQWIQHPNVNGQITMRQLLSNKSGIYNFTDNPDFTDSVFVDLNRIWNPQDALQFIKAPVFNPGAAWAYSNSNFVIAGLILEQVTGKPLKQLLQELLYDSLGFSGTYLFPEEMPNSVIPHVWSGSLNMGNYLENIVAIHSYSHQSLFSLAWAAGAIISTAEENAIFWSKLVNGEIINSASWEAMTGNLTFMGSGMDYGMGIMRIRNLNGRPVWSHGGTNLGFINENLGDPQTGVGISVLTNQDSVSNAIIRSKVVASLHKVTLNPPVDNTIIETQSIDPKVTFYPNPTKGDIQISGLKGETLLTIYSLSGGEVISITVEPNQTIHLHALPKGLYLAKLVDKQEGLLLNKKLLVE